MIISKSEQGTEEWFKERAGIPTASNFDKIVTTKGVASKSAKKYMYQLAGERITGTKEETYQNANMTRGIELEGEARQAYSLLTDRSVEEVGLCYLDDNRAVGASPDGLVGDHGLIEIKCPTLAVTVEYLMNEKCYMAYWQQLQGQLYVTGRMWVDYVTYFPGMPLNVVRVERDEGFIESLKFELNIFNAELNKVVETIK